MSRARQTSREVAEEAARDGDRRAQGRAALGFSGGRTAMEVVIRRLLVQALFEAGDLRHAEVEVSRSERVSARLGRAEYMWYPPLWRASLALARGQMQARWRARAQLEAVTENGCDTPKG